MDANYHADLMRCVDLMRDHLASGDSFVLAKKKAMRYLFLNKADEKIIQGLREYQEMKKQYLNQHRDDKSWTNKLTNS